MTTAEFIERFQYRRGRPFSTWKPCDRPPYEGACGSFAATVDKLEGGGGRFWLVKSPSNDFFPRHIALHMPGKGWIDSTRRKWRETPEPHTKILPLPAPWVWFRKQSVYLQILEIGAIVAVGTRLYLFGGIL